ncbi:MAG: iron export ABC transporter permease subunit FetB [Rhodospirillales bacterium]|nr:iron export ABC transporter permease subunit FetB [Rhodospirillales bacterium]
MTPILLSWHDLAIAALLVVVDGALSLWLGLALHRQLFIAAARMVVQLIAVGFVLRAVFYADHPALTALVLLAMAAMAAREVAARPQARFGRFGNFTIGAGAVGMATILTATLALTTAIRPDPWYAARYAIPLAGIVLGNVMNASSLALDSLLGGVAAERVAIEAQLCLGANFRAALLPLIRASIRRALLPTVNTMSAAGIITLPGIMTGQILAGMDPIEAVKYQILLMFLLAGGSGIGAVATVYLAAARLTDERQRLRLDRLVRKPV